MIINNNLKKHTIPNFLLLGLMDIKFVKLLAKFLTLSLIISSPDGLPPGKGDLKETGKPRVWLRSQDKEGPCLGKSSSTGLLATSPTPSLACQWPCHPGHQGLWVLDGTGRRCKVVVGD